MITYTKTIKVTEKEFNTCQEEIKTVIRQIVDARKDSLLETFPATRVEFLVSMKGETLENSYTFNFKRLDNGEEHLVSQLIVNIEIVESQKNI